MGGVPPCSDQIFATSEPNSIVTGVIHIILLV